MKPVFLLLLAAVAACFAAMGMHGQPQPDGPTAIVYEQEGQLPVREGIVQKGADNWLITNLSGDGARYFKQAEVNVPEGYSYDPNRSPKADPNETAFWMVPEAGTEINIEYCYIGGLATSASEMASLAQSQYVNFYGKKYVSEVKTAQIGGSGGVYFTLYWEAEAEMASARSITITCYFPAMHDSSIILSAAVLLEEGAPIPADDELLECIEPFVRGIRIEQDTN